MAENFLPLVQDTTKTQSESIQTILQKLNNGRVFIPDYQRDSEQWDPRKKSLFIESLLNNLTIPAFFFSEEEKLKNEVVDGQQRLQTIWDFSEDRFTINNDQSIDYITPQSALYAGKKFSELGEDLKNIFLDYPLTIIFLPKSMPLQTKLEIFRRINEGGTPLSGQDIRLAYYSESKSVTFIRLAGIYDKSSESTVEDSDGENDTERIKPFQRMIQKAAERGVFYPWDNYPEARNVWSEWWTDTKTAKGQTASLMFLWYLMCLDRKNLNSLLEHLNHLPISFAGSTENAMDIYCAQLKYQESEEGKGKLNILSTFDEITNNHFQGFAQWINVILSRGLTGISPEKYKQIALLIAGAVELKISPNKLSNKQWELLGSFIRKPRETAQKILAYDSYPEPKGRWTGNKGQKKQCDTVVEIVRTILK